jgi:hypothetical protein
MRPRPDRTSRRAHVTALAFGIWFATGCSAPRPTSAVEGETVYEMPRIGAPCIDGQTASCGIQLGTDGSTVDCVSGVQVCEGGLWSACRSTGTFTKVAAPEPIAPEDDSPGVGTRALAGSATTCIDNPCNPNCRSWRDVPDAAIRSDATTTITVGERISLQASNVPPGFAQKGSDPDKRCGGPLAASACQYDQRCGLGAECAGSTSAWTDGSGVTRCCVGFAPGEKGCNGVDVTAPAVCTPLDTTKRAITVCNRGTLPLTTNVKCLAFPGNSPQFPNDSPGVGVTVLDTALVTGQQISVATPIVAGDCRSYLVPASNFKSNGNTSVFCNPPNVAAGTVTTVESFPTTVLSSDGWSNAISAVSDLDLGASATTDLDQTVLGPNFAGAASNSVGFDGATLSNATGSTTGTWANAPFVATTVGPRVPTATQTCSAAAPCPGGSTCSAGVCIACTPSATCGANALFRGVVDNGSTRTAITLADATATSALAAVDSAGSASATNLWRYARADLPRGADTTATLGTFGFSSVIPSSTTAEVQQITLSIRWWASHRSLAGVVRLYSSTGVLLVEGVRDWDKNPTTDQWLNDTFTFHPVGLKTNDVTGMRVQLYVSRSTGGGSGGTSEWAGVDNVAVSVRYRETQASVDLGSFGAYGALPVGSTINGVLARVRWRASVASAETALGVTPFSALGPALGSEGVFSVPGGYVANATVTTSQVWPLSSATSLDVANPGFRVRTRLSSPASAGDLTAGIDTVEAAILGGVGPASKTIWLGGFGFDLPPGSTNVQVTTTGNWRATAPNTNAVTRLVASFDGGATTARSGADVAPPTAAFATANDGPFLSPSASGVLDPNFAIGVTATVAGTSKYTASVDWLRARVSYTAGAITGNVGECNPSNNWTSLKANPVTACDPKTVITVPPWTYSRVFDGICPNGTRTQWRRFGYESATPAGTRIEFRFRAFAPDASGKCVQQAAITTSPPNPLVTAQRTEAIDTQICDVHRAPATASCPVDLATGLGLPASQLQCLQMDAYGVTNGSTGDSPALSSWRAIFDCVPSE